MPPSGNTTRWLHHQYTLTISPLYSQAVPGTISYRYSESRELTLQQYSTPMSHCPPARHACSLDPYIIAGWDISANKSNGLEISNTDAYFVIRDVYVHSGYDASGDQSAGGYNGTLFKNVTNGLVETSTIYGNKFGVSVISSDSLAIRDNIIQNNSRGAIEMDSSSNIEVGQNDVSNNPNTD